MTITEKVKKEVEEEDACNAHEQESTDSVVHVEEETTNVEILANLKTIHDESLPDKKKKKWSRIFNKKAKNPKEKQLYQEEPLSREEDPSDDITVVDLPSQHTMPNSDTSQQKKTSKWSKCKKFFRNISSKNRKGRKHRSPPNNISISQSEDISNENQRTGLFMCWRRRSSKKKRGTTFSSIPCEESERGYGPMTWTDPVVHIPNSRPKITKTDLHNIPEEAHDVDALSFASVTLSDLSSLDILSLLEGDNSRSDNTASAKYDTLDKRGEVDKMDSHDFRDEHCLTELSQEGRSYPNASDDSNVIEDFPYCNTKTATNT